MNRRIFSMMILVLVAALALSACEAIDDYSQRRGDRDRLIPGTGDTRDNRNDHWNDNRNDNWNNNRNDNWNDNRNDNWNDNRNDNWNDNRNDNWNDNRNDNGGPPPGVPPAGNGPPGGVPPTGNGPPRDDSSSRDDEVGRHNLYRVDELTGQSLETQDGQRMGRIDSLLVHPGTGRVHYLVVEADRDLGHERGYVLVPWNALHTWSPNPYEGVPPGHLPPPEQRQPMNCRDLPPGHLPPPHLRDELCLDYGDIRDDRSLVFGFGRDTMARSPSYTRDEIDDIRHGRWEDDYTGYWRGHLDDVPRMDDDARNRGYLRLHGDGYDLLDRDRDRIARIDDFRVDVPEGQVAYAVVDTGGLFQSERVLLPFDRLNWSPEDEAFVTDLHEDELERLPREGRD
jgi:sporulation protein YlmC with PRC-barrel domain